MGESLGATDPPFAKVCLFQNLRRFVFKEKTKFGFDFKYFKEPQFQKFSWPVGPNHGGPSLDTNVSIFRPPFYFVTVRPWKGIQKSSRSMENFMKHSKPDY